MFMHPKMYSVVFGLDLTVVFDVFSGVLSRMYHQVEVEAAAVEEVRDRWYLRMLSEIQASPLKYKDWIVEEGKLYKYREDPLLGEIIDGED